jgi:hypothetical protein
MQNVVGGTERSRLSGVAAGDQACPTVHLRTGREMILVVGQPSTNEGVHDRDTASPNHGETVNVWSRRPRPRRVTRWTQGRGDLTPAGTVAATDGQGARA